MENFSFSPSSQQLDKLEAEVRKKLCTVVHIGVGQVLRVVSLIAVRLERLDGLVLVKLAKWNGQTAEPDCALPGRKYEQGLTPQECLQSLLSGKLACFTGGDVNVLYTERVVQSKESKDFGVATKYIKTVVVAQLDDHDRQDPRDPAIEISSRNRTSGSDRATTRNTQRQTYFDPMGDRPVYFLPNEDKSGKGTFYAYIKYDELEFFNSSEGERPLSDWVARLDVRFMQGNISEGNGSWSERGGRATGALTRLTGAFRASRKSRSTDEAKRKVSRNSIYDGAGSVSMTPTLSTNAKANLRKSSPPARVSVTSSTSTEAVVDEIVTQTPSLPKPKKAALHHTVSFTESTSFAADSTNTADPSLMASVPSHHPQQSPPPAAIGAGSDASDMVYPAPPYTNGKEGADNGMVGDDLQRLLSSDRFRFGEAESTEQEKVFTFA